MTVTSERLPKIPYLVKLCHEMIDLGASEFSLGVFSVKFDPLVVRRGAHVPTDTIEPTTSKDEAREAIRLAMEKVQQAEKDEEDALYWSAPS